jgi:SRSO17 transposase
MQNLLRGREFIFVVCELSWNTHNQCTTSAIDNFARRARKQVKNAVIVTWRGESGKVDNCVVGQHLLYTDNDPKNPFSCTLASDLYLPEGWASDRPRCEEAKIPNEVTYRPKWRIAIDQVQEAVGNGVRFSWLTFDEDYGSVPEFWFELDRLGQRGIGEVRSNFLVWPRLPRYQSTQAAHAAKRVDNVCRFSPAFREQGWYRLNVQHFSGAPSRFRRSASISLLPLKFAACCCMSSLPKRLWSISKSVPSVFSLIGRNAK